MLMVASTPSPQERPRVTDASHQQMITIRECAAAGSRSGLRAHDFTFL